MNPHDTNTATATVATSTTIAAAAAAGGGGAGAGGGGGGGGGQKICLNLAGLEWAGSYYCPALPRFRLLAD